METWFTYAPQAMARHRRISMARTLAFFVLTIGAGLAVDRLPTYREAISKFEMGRAFIFTLPAIVLALVTYFSGWEMRRQQSESLARYRPTQDALLRECRGEEPERIPWDRIERVDKDAIITILGGRLPFYPALIENGARLLAAIHREVDRLKGTPPPASLPHFHPDEIAPRADGTPPPWPARLPRPGPLDHAAWAYFYEQAVRAQDEPAREAGRAV